MSFQGASSGVDPGFVDGGGGGVAATIGRQIIR